MAYKRKVKLPGRFMDDQRWYIIQFSADEELSDPVPGNQVEDEETGETGTERHFHSGDRCSAPWLDGKSYDGSVVFESASKEDCLKYLSQKKKITKRKTVSNKGSKRKTGADQTGLAEKKKEKSASKKLIDQNRKEVEIKAAEHLFLNSIETLRFTDNTITQANTQPPILTNNAADLTYTTQEPAPSPSPMTYHSSAYMPSPCTNTPTVTQLLHTASTLTQRPSQASTSTFTQLAPHVQEARLSHTASSLTQRPSQASTSTFTQLAPHVQEARLLHTASSLTQRPSQASTSTFTQLAPHVQEASPSHTASSLTQRPSQASTSTFTKLAPHVQEASPSHTFSTLTQRPSQASTSTITQLASHVQEASPSHTASTLTQRPSQATTPIRSTAFMQIPCTPKQTKPSTNHTHTAMHQPLTSTPKHVSQYVHTPLTHSQTTSDSSIRSVDESQPWHSSFTQMLNEDSSFSYNYESPSLQTASQNQCVNCRKKEDELQSVRQYCLSLENQVARLREDSENYPPSSRRHLMEQEANHYYPRRGQRIDKCVYILKDDCNQIPDDHVALVPGQPVYVKHEWLNHVQASFKGKSKKVAVKNLMSGIYEPEEVQHHTASSLIATPMGKALREYSIMKLSMDMSTLTNAINSKIGTMKRALVKERVRRF